MKQINWGWTVQRIDGSVGSSIGSADSGQPDRYQTTKRLGIRHSKPPEKLIAGGRTPTRVEIHNPRPEPCAEERARRGLK